MDIATEGHVAYVSLKLGGNPAPTAIMEDLLECIVENSLHLPDMCTLRMHDAKFVWLDAKNFREGTKLEVMAGEEGGGGLQPLFFGEIAALELDLAGHGVPTLTVRAYDYSHRLHRGRFQRSFVEMKDSDIVQQVAGEMGFSVDHDETSQVHKWILQNNQTNWEFLTQRAAYNGFRLYVQGEKKLFFKKVDDKGHGVVQLEWGKNLRSFRPRVAATHQVNEVVVRGWDPQAKQAIVGRCTKPTGIPQIGETTPGGDVASSAFGSARMVVVDRPVHSQAEAEDVARSICDDIGNEFIEAEGLCYGEPSLMPGMMVQIENIGQRFSGKYTVTATTHTYTPAEGFTTLFSVSGKRPSTVLSLLDEEGGGTRAHLGGNIVVGVVTDNLDPDDLGRVKVKYPWLTEDHTSYWVRLAVPMAGPGRGFYYLPEIDDEVLVAFEHGDIRRPYIIGALWNGKDTPIEGNSDALQGNKVVHRIIKTRIGHTVLLDDTDGTGQIRLTTNGGHVVVLDDKNKNIMAQTTNGHKVILDDQNQNITAQTTNGHKILMDDQGRQIVVQDMTESNKMTIDSTQNSITFECLGNFNINATGQVSIQGTEGVNIQTPAMMSLQASAEMSVQAAGEMTIQGAMVMINS